MILNDAVTYLLGLIRVTESISLRHNYDTSEVVFIVKRYADTSCVEVVKSAELRILHEDMQTNQRYIINIVPQMKQFLIAFHKDE